MKLSKKIIFFLFLLTLNMPVGQVKSQDIKSETDIIQQDESSDDATTKKDKKKNKDKEKDVIEITEKFYVCLGIDLFTVILIILLIYYPNNKRTEFIFTFILFNVVIFLLTFVLDKVKISMGAAFGLFAVFSMLRYRTEGLSLKDMTYLFIFIALGLIAAIQLDYHELGIINGLILVLTFFLDGNIFGKREYSEIIRYENIELIKPECRSQLMEDVGTRIGRNVHRVKITQIDFLRDSAQIEVFYYKKKGDL
ncbi:MAG: DUF4956 domain-containing protein [Bacteroidota bacterium]